MLPHVLAHESSHSMYDDHPRRSVARRCWTMPPVITLARATTVGVRAAPAVPARRLQRPPEILNDVDQVFQPHGDADHPLWDAARRPLLSREAPLRDGGRM